MQVEYKTEKGKVLFVLPSSDAFDVRIRFKRFITWRTKFLSHIELFNEGITVIGLSTEISEEQLTKIFNPKIGILYEMFGYNYLTSDVRNTFKSLMQHLKVYEVNPYNFECENQWCDNGYIDMGYNEKLRCSFCEENEDNQDEAQSRTGKWIILFKPNV